MGLIDAFPWLWDPVKQRAAMNAFEWAVVQKEQSPDLIERYETFMASLKAADPA